MGNRIFNNHTPYQMVNQLTKYIGTYVELPVKQLGFKFIKAYEKTLLVE